MKKEPSKAAALIVGTAFGASVALFPLMAKLTLLQNRHKSALRELEAARRANPAYVRLERGIKELGSKLRHGGEENPANRSVLRQIDQFSREKYRVEGLDRKIKKAAQKATEADTGVSRYSAWLWPKLAPVGIVGGVVGGAAGLRGHLVNKRRRQRNRT